MMGVILLIDLIILITSSRWSHRQKYQMLQMTLKQDHKYACILIASNKYDPIQYINILFKYFMFVFVFFSFQKLFYSASDHKLTFYIQLIHYCHHLFRSQNVDFVSSVFISVCAFDTCDWIYNWIYNP